MFKIDDDMTINATRGDCGTIDVSATVDGAVYVFLPGDILRLKVFEKKNCENVVLKKDFGVEIKTDTVTLTLTGKDTKFGGIINKPTNYWYEIELNPETNPQTIVGYDDDGPKLFCLHPEGNEVEETEPDETDMGAFDDKLDLTSNKALPNKVIAQAFYSLQGKVNQYPTDVISVESWGVTGDGETDVTDKLNAMFASLKGGETVYFPNGTYRVSAKRFAGMERWYGILIENKNNIRIEMSPKALIKADLFDEWIEAEDRFAQTQFGIFYFNHCSNIEILGGSIIGERDRHRLNADCNQGLNSGINGIEMKYCKNIHIHDMDISNCFGDGIILGVLGFAHEIANSNIVIENCHIYDCERNGITYGAVHDGVIRNCIIHDIKGHSPEAGIDLESEWVWPKTNNEYDFTKEGYPEQRNQNIRIENCIMYDASGQIEVSKNSEGKDHGIGVMQKGVSHSTESYDTIISNCEFRELSILQSVTSFGEIKVVNSIFNHMSYCHRCIVENCKIETITSSSAEVAGDAQGLFKNCLIQGSLVDGHIMNITRYGDTVLFDRCMFRRDDTKFTTGKKNHFFTYSAKAPKKDKNGNVIKTYVQTAFSASLHDCTMYLWDYIKAFDECPSGSYSLLELIKCKFVYKNTVASRPLIYAILPQFKMIDCVIDYGESQGNIEAGNVPIHIKQEDEKSFHTIIGNKVIGNTKFKSFVAFGKDSSGNLLDLGTTNLVNNIGINLNAIKSNEATGTLKEYGNVTTDTLNIS